MTGAIQINFGMMKWELLTAAILLVIAVLISRGRNVKSAVIFACVTLFFLVSAFALKLLVYFGLENPTEAISIAIAWGPTVLFVFTLVSSAIWGAWRGFRKSAIFMLHAVCAAALCIGLFFFFVKSEFADKALFNAANAFAGGDICGALGVSEECSAMREVFAEWIPSLFNYGTEVDIILRNNGAYLITLVDMAYRIAFGLLMYVLYLILLFVMYIVYHAAYSERKYKRRKEQLLHDNKTDRSYRKHGFYGALIGLTRGIAAGLIGLSFLGSMLYMAADIGRSGAQKADFENTRIDFGYSIYSAVENYGESGIFAFLNMLRDDDNQPYYLFAADLILSGNLHDENNNIHANIKFRKEIGAYSEFARNTFDLMMRYGGEEMRSAIDGGDVKTAMGNVFKDEKFQAEFENLIDEFDTQTYFINFALSAATSIVANFERMSFAGSVSETNTELMKVLFCPGYLSDKIPEERELIEKGGEETRPYIGVPQLYDKRDAKIYYKLVSSFLFQKPSGTEAVIELVRSLVPQIKQLSVFSSASGAKLDPVLGRMYCFLANTYLAGSEQSAVRYNDVVKAKVDWTREINDLLDVIDDGMTLYEAYSDGDGSQMNKLLSIFDSDRDGYEVTAAAYDGVVRKIENSKLLGQIFSTGFIHEKLKGVFESAGGNMYVPRYVRYENSEEGFGELHNLFFGLKQLGRKDNRETIEKLLSGGEVNLENIFGLIVGATEHSDENGNTLSDYIVESMYLRSLLSCIMTDNADIIYVPAAALEKDSSGRTVNLINKPTMIELFGCLSDRNVSDAILKFAEREEDASASVSELIGNDAVAAVLCGGNVIIEGTVAKQLEEVLRDYDKVRIPSSLKVTDGVLPEGWLTVGGIDGELSRIVKALRLKGLDIDAVFEKGQIDNDMLGSVMNNEENKDPHIVLTDSDILRYTISASIINKEIKFGNGFDLTVPVSVVETMGVDSVISKKEMQAICKSLPGIKITGGTTSRELVTNLISMRVGIESSAVLSASAANYIVTEYEKDGGMLASSGIVIPSKYVRAGQKAALENLGGNAALWQEELGAFATAAEILFGTDGEIKADGALIGSLAADLRDFNDVYASRIVAATFTHTIKTLDGMPISDHPNAYDGEFIREKEIYRQGEVSALLELMDRVGKNDLGSFATKDIRAGDLKEFICDDEGNTQSWLLSATLSKHLLEKPDLIVPVSVADSVKEDSILPEELGKLISAFIIIGGNGSIEEWKPEWKVPTATQAETMLCSAVIRATITHEVRFQNGGSGRRLYFKEENVTVSPRLYTGDKAESDITVAVSISQSQLVGIFAILNPNDNDSESSFELPEFKSIGDVTGLAPADAERYAACDALCEQISRPLIAVGASGYESGRFYDICNMNMTNMNAVENKPCDVNYFTPEKIVEIISRLK